MSHRAERKEKPQGVPVELGMKVIRRPVNRWDNEGNKMTKPTSGIVTYVHPQGRFHEVTFSEPGGLTWKESFAGTMDYGEQTT